MSYDISFRVKVEGLDNVYVEPYGDNTDANITYNVREMIIKSTGLENWCADGCLGLCKDIIPHIANGLAELEKHPEKYKQYESPNGWGTVKGLKHFFACIINDWTSYCEDYSTETLADVTYFYIC